MAKQRKSYKRKMKIIKGGKKSISNHRMPASVVTRSLVRNHRPNNNQCRSSINQFIDFFESMHNGLYEKILHLRNVDTITDARHNDLKRLQKDVVNFFNTVEYYIRNNACWHEMPYHLQEHYILRTNHITSEFHNMYESFTKKYENANTPP
jgi:hypothetical protein